MFNDLDYMNSELHRKDLLRQSEADRLFNSATPSKKRNGSLSINGWASLQSRYIRVAWSTIASILGFSAQERQVRHR